MYLATLPGSGASIVAARERFCAVSICISGSRGLVNVPYNRDRRCNVTSVSAILILGTPCARRRTRRFVRRIFSTYCAGGRGSTGPISAVRECAGGGNFITTADRLALVSLIGAGGACSVVPAFGSCRGNPLYVSSSRHALTGPCGPNRVFRRVGSVVVICLGTGTFCGRVTVTRRGGGGGRN